MIRINEEKIDFEDGMTVADALKKAGKNMDNMTLIMVGKKILCNYNLDEEILVDDSEIKLLTIISGG